MGRTYTKMGLTGLQAEVKHLQLARSEGMQAKGVHSAVPYTVIWGNKCKQQFQMKGIQPATSEGMVK
jgi:hypothetical protein